MVLCLDKMLENDCSYICFLLDLSRRVESCDFLFHRYSYVKTDAWVYLEYLVESVIWEVVFPPRNKSR